MLVEALISVTVAIKFPGVILMRKNNAGSEGLNFEAGNNMALLLAESCVKYLLE